MSERMVELLWRSHGNRPRRQIGPAFSLLVLDENRRVRVGRSLGVVGLTEQLCESRLRGRPGKYSRQLTADPVAASWRMGNQPDGNSRSAIRPGIPPLSIPWSKAVERLHPITQDRPSV